MRRIAFAEGRVRNAGPSVHSSTFAAASIRRKGKQTRSRAFLHVFAISHSVLEQQDLPTVYRVGTEILHTFSHISSRSRDLPSRSSSVSPALQGDSSIHGATSYTLGLTYEPARGARLHAAFIFLDVGTRLRACEARHACLERTRATVRPPMAGRVIYGTVSARARAKLNNGRVVRGTMRLQKDTP
ncbi:hypothetical protein MRX96_028747 [Rhipicephalus microplus]